MKEAHGIESDETEDTFTASVSYGGEIVGILDGNIHTLKRLIAVEGHAPINTLSHCVITSHL